MRRASHRGTELLTLDGAPAGEETDEEHDERHDEKQPQQVTHPDPAACRGEDEQNDQHDQQSTHAASFDCGRRIRYPSRGLQKRPTRYHARIVRLRNRPSALSLPAVWLIVGVVVAAIYDYFDSLGTVGRVLTVIAAVVFWPLLLFGFDIRISR